MNDYKWQGCMRYICGVLQILRVNIRLSKIRSSKLWAVEGKDIMKIYVVP